MKHLNMVLLATATIFVSFTMTPDTASARGRGGAVAGAIGAAIVGAAIIGSMQASQAQQNRRASRPARSRSTDEESSSRPAANVVQQRPPHLIEVSDPMSRKDPFEGVLPASANR